MNNVDLFHVEVDSIRLYKLGYYSMYAVPYFQAYSDLIYHGVDSMRLYKLRYNSMYVSIRLIFCVCFFQLLLFIFLILMWGPLPFLSLLKIWNIFLREKQPLIFKNKTWLDVVCWLQSTVFILLQLASFLNLFYIWWM